MFLVLVATVTVYYFQLRAMRDQLRSTQQAVDQNAVSGRTVATFRFVERWNSPELRSLRSAWHRICEEFQQNDAPQMIKMLEEDSNRYETVTDVLNFFEEVALAVNAKTIDGDLLRRLLGETMKEYYSTVLPWVEQRRLGRADAWTELSTLIKAWGA